MFDLTRLGWAQEDHAFLHLWASRFQPGGTPSHRRSWCEQMRAATCADTAVRLLRSCQHRCAGSSAQGQMSGSDRAPRTRRQCTDRRGPIARKPHSPLPLRPARHRKPHAARRRAGVGKTRLRGTKFSRAAGGRPFNGTQMLAARHAHAARARRSGRHRRRARQRRDRRIALPRGKDGPRPYSPEFFDKICVEHRYQAIVLPRSGPRRAGRLVQRRRYGTLSRVPSQPQCHAGTPASIRLASPALKC